MKEDYAKLVKNLKHVLKQSLWNKSFTKLFKDLSAHYADNSNVALKCTKKL